MHGISDSLLADVIRQLDDALHDSKSLESSWQNIDMDCTIDLRSEPCVAGESTAGRKLNRYSDVLPFDCNRVKLAGLSPDYINASHIQVPLSEISAIQGREANNGCNFIMCQGPTVQDADRFWKMVCQEGADTIVMLTRCEEGGREKCHEYWEHPSVSVVSSNSQSGKGLVDRKIEIRHGQGIHSIRQLHYIDWPDYGVPSSAKTMASLIFDLSSHWLHPDRSFPKKPLVVHCSAGVGRSGTFVAAVCAMSAICQSPVELDKAGGVKKLLSKCMTVLRRQRMMSIQRPAQYVFLHALVKECCTLLLKHR